MTIVARKLGILAITLLLILITCIGVTGYFIQSFSLTRQQGVSMSPALNDGDVVLVRGHIKGISRGDIVVFRYPDDQSISFVKRIIGLPGESVEIRDGRVFINGSALDEPYLATQNMIRDQMSLTIIPDQSFFVLGDNRRNSHDSRHWGTLPKKLISGKVVFW